VLGAGKNAVYHLSRQREGRLNVMIVLRNIKILMVETGSGEILMLFAPIVGRRLLFLLSQCVAILFFVEIVLVKN